MIRIARIGNYPTDIYNKVGFHGYQLGASNKLETFYISANVNGVVLPPLGNSKVKIFNFFLQTYPVNGSVFKKIIFTIKRIFSILIFSTNSILYLLPKMIDIVHIHSPMYVLIAIWGKLSGKKIYITFHGEDFHRIKSSRLYSWFSFIYDGVFAISPTMIDRLKEIHTGTKVLLVGNGIEEEFQDYGRERKKQIIFVGSFKPVKAHQMMIDGFELFHKQKENYKLILVGDGPLFNQMKDYVESKGLTSNIDFLGQKNMNQLIELYNESEIFALNSFSEGFPKVLLEALGCGCRIVSTKVGSVPEIMGCDYPYFIENHIPKGISDALLSVANAESTKFEEYESILKRYSWENVREIYINLYEINL
ncbi:MAG: glycosyltransferase family 4 protein [Saprospiraceae bacterium]|nr:glycosyltransferase family 4 protein [Saprospiraceae bacterium]